MTSNRVTCNRSSPLIPPHPTLQLSPYSAQPFTVISSDPPPIHLCAQYSPYLPSSTILLGAKTLFKAASFFYLHQTASPPILSLLTIYNYPAPRFLYLFHCLFNFYLHRGRHLSLFLGFSCCNFKKHKGGKLNRALKSVTNHRGQIIAFFHIPQYCCRPV